MFGNTKENRHGSQSDYFNALKVRTFYGKSEILTYVSLFDELSLRIILMIPLH